MDARHIRAAGFAAATGGVVWGVTTIVSPSTRQLNSAAEIWASGVFQLGLAALLAAMWVTAATGRGRVARTVLAAEGVALALAVAWTVPYLFDANREPSEVLVVLDAFWPLSMVGFIVVGALVARAGVWPSPVRWLPLAASLLIPVDIAVIGAPADVRTAVMGVYLSVMYGACGLALASQADQVVAAGEAKPLPGRVPSA